MQLSEKDQWLIEQNFYKKIYGSCNHPTEEFPLCDWNEEMGDYCCYKIEPFPVSDSEYEAMRRETEERAAVSTSSNNTTASVLRGFGWIVIMVGFVFGLVVGMDEYRGELTADFTVILPIWLESLVGGCLIIGVSEIITLLHKKGKK